VVSNTPKTLVEIIPVLMEQLIDKLSAESSELRMVAGKSLGELVRYEDEYLYAYVYLCMNLYVYIYTYIYIFIYMVAGKSLGELVRYEDEYLYACVYLCMNLYVYIYIYTYLYVYICIYGGGQESRRASQV
jgi:dolichyl-phosphate-mannose--protein O-mannosyl transferase